MMTGDTQYFAVGIAVGAFYAVAAEFYTARYGRQLEVGKLYRGIVNVLTACPEDAACISQIQLLYKRLSEKYRRLRDTFRSGVDILEEMICSIDTMEPARFKRAYGMELPTEARSRLVQILGLMRATAPFSSLSPKESNLLSALKQAIDAGNADLGRNALSQVADEIEILEKNLRIQEGRTRASFLISLVGIVLTTFFGLLSFVLVTR